MQILNLFQTVFGQRSSRKTVRLLLIMLRYFLHSPDKFDRYVVLSFTNRSLVLSVGEVLEEVENTELLTTQPTIAIQQPGTESLLQVHPLGIRYILPTGVATEWPAPTGTTIVTAATNNRQVAVALSSTELVYFEVDLDGHLNEYQERKTLGSTILALSLAEVLEGEKRTPYLVRSRVFVAFFVFTVFLGYRL